jgi:hypothetical protein
MSNRKNESGSVSFFTIAAAAVAICGTAAALMLMPEQPSTEASAANAVTYSAAGEVGYLPAQVENQAPEIQPLPEQF